MSTNKMADDDANTSEPKNEKCISFKYTTYSCDVVGKDSKSDGDISLQEAFRLYREAKQDELRQARMLRKRQELRKADPQKMAALRQKFVNQAKKYYGYPYAKKYWPPDSPEYKSKLFLDCCGLVRKVMRDLAEDFGFIIGPWNQAYMFDTLPIKVEREKDMKPGDLVFISATYYNPKSKKQRHNMTHVEIWAGEGNKTIGSRWNNGKVQMFDHYKFLAKSYHSETYHLRSIDTWLKGICTSHCSQHTWRRSKYNPSKKSIFSLPEQADQDEGAGDDDNIDSFTVRGNTFIDGVTAGVSKMVQQCKKAEAERPRTDMDLRQVHSDSSLSMATPSGEPAKFPAIKNNLGEKGKVGKRTKGRNDCVGRDNTEIGDRKHEGVNDSTEGAAASDRYDKDKPELDEVNKSLGQLSISGSLTDLGKKGFYLKDLVDSQKKEENPSNEETEEGEEREAKCASGEESGSDDEYLSNGSEEDFDDDYFIFVKNDPDSDEDVEEKKVCDVRDGRDALPETVSESNCSDVEGPLKKEVSGVSNSQPGNVSVTDTSSSDIMSESKHVEGEVKDDLGKSGLVSKEGESVKVHGDSNKIEVCGDGKTIEEGKERGRLEMNEAHEGVKVVCDDTGVLNVMSASGTGNGHGKGEGDEVKLGGSSCNECKDGVEGMNVQEEGVERSEKPLADGSAGCDGRNDEPKGLHTDLTLTDAAKNMVTETNEQNDASLAGCKTKTLNSHCLGNTNENANPKTTELAQSNKPDKLKSECIKPSVVTMVSQAPQTCRPRAASQTMSTPVVLPVPVDSSTSITPPVTQSSGSNSSCDFEDRMKTDSSTGAK